jgi:ribonuclease D
MTTLEKAQSIKEKGSTLSIEKIIAIIEKEEARKNKRAKKSDKRWAKREAQEKISQELDNKLNMMTATERLNYFENVKRQSLLNQLGSSMKK